VLKDLGELAEARPLLEQALASLRANLTDHHPHVILVRNNLAKVEWGLGAG
jgi:hypothetical protein